MTRDEIVTALRCCVSILPDCCKTCPVAPENGCEDAIKTYATDLIENQQRHIEALMLANGSLKDAVLRRDEQIEKLAADRKALINELCQYCEEYEYLYKGSCDECKWRGM